MGKRSPKESRHVRLYHWILDTPAWKSLDGNSRALYVALADHYFGNNNGRISFSTRQAAEELHISKATASRCFAALIERGFITIEKLGHFDTKRKHATEYRLTEFASNIDDRFVTKEFASWRPAEVVTQLRRRTRCSSPLTLSKQLPPGKLYVGLS
jgi:hypothetical protein